MKKRIWRSACKNQTAKRVDFTPKSRISRCEFLEERHAIGSMLPFFPGGGLLPSFGGVEATAGSNDCAVEALDLYVSDVRVETTPSLAAVDGASGLGARGTAGSSSASRSSVDASPVFRDVEALNRAQTETSSWLFDAALDSSEGERENGVRASRPMFVGAGLDAFNENASVSPIAAFTGAEGENSSASTASLFTNEPSTEGAPPASANFDAPTLANFASEANAPADSKAVLDNADSCEVNDESAEERKEESVATNAPLASSNVVASPFSVVEQAKGELKTRLYDFFDVEQSWTLDAWGTSENAGRVEGADGKAILYEGDSFATSLKKTLTVPDGAVEYRFSYDLLSFDLSSDGTMNDAFEAALVDADGFALTSVWAAGRDAFFNVSEGENATTGVDVKIDRVSNVATVSVPLNAELSGTDATLLFRWTNNDGDGGSRVRLLDYGFVVYSANSEPTVSSADVLGKEGNEVSVSAFFTDDDLEDSHVAFVDWGDGSDETPLSISEESGSGVAFGSHIYPDDGVYDVSIRVVDDKNGVGRADLKAEIANVAPTLEAFADFAAVADGEVYALETLIVGSFADLGFDNPRFGTSETFEASIDWGDGCVEPLALDVIPGANGVATLGTFEARRVLSDGEQNIKIVLKDDDGGEAQAEIAFVSSIVDVKPAIRDGLSLDPNGLPIGLYPVVVGGTEDFDPATLLATSLEFGPGAALEENAQFNFADVARLGQSPDGITDAIAHFSTWDALLTEDDSVAWLQGRTVDGKRYVGLGTLSVASLSARIPLAFSEEFPRLKGRDVANETGAPTKFFVVDNFNDQMFQYAESGSFNGDFALSKDVYNARGVAASADGSTLWTIDAATKNVAVYDADGTRTGGWTATDVVAPEGVSVCGDDLWLVDATTNRVYFYEGAAEIREGAWNATSSFALDDANADASDLVVGERFVWVVDEYRDATFVYSFDGECVGTWRLDPQNADPSGITLDPTGKSTDLWVVDRADATVYRYAFAQSYLDKNSPNYLTTDVATAADRFALADGNARPEGIADPPAPEQSSLNRNVVSNKIEINATTPSATTGLPSGSTLTLAGEAVSTTTLSDGSTFREQIAAVYLNGRAVDALDQNGRFFATTAIVAGLNEFEARVLDKSGNERTKTFQIWGRSDVAQNFDVSEAFRPLYAQTSFNEATDLVYARLAIENVGGFSTSKPFYVGVTNVSDPRVTLKNFAGVYDGVCYYDYSELIDGAKLDAEEATGWIDATFYNPARVPFTYDLVYLTTPNEAPYFTSVPRTEALVGKTYAYQASAIDPDGDELTFSFLTAPDGATIDPQTGRVVWVPRAEQLRNFEFEIQVADADGAVATQKFTVEVVAEAANRAPVITSTPEIATKISSTKPGQKMGDVYPDFILFDEKNDVFTETINLRLKDFQTGLGSADVIFVVDESGSMSGEQRWIRDLVFSLDASLEARGVVDNRYGLVGFADVPRIFQNASNETLTSPNDFAEMAKNLSVGRSGNEDGYYGVYSALNSYNFRETAVPIVVLITDEGRTNVNTQLNYSKLVNEVVEKNALLHGVFEANFYDKNGKRALGASYFGDAYLAGASATEYTVSTGGYCARGDWNTKETYVELLWDENVKGTAWDLNILRDGGAAAEQFSNAFVDYLTRDVLTRIPISISVDPGVEGVSNLSGIQTGTPGDKVASFDVQIDATVAPDYFYIYFKNAETGEQLGAIPVFFKGDGLYVYDVEAYDPDFDELSYSLTTAPNGMWLEPTTGLILWSPNYGDQGEHNVTVEVADGRGGVASQAFVVSVVDDANVAPTIVSKPATEIYVETQNDGLTFEALYEYDCEALDQDGDALTYSLLLAPEGMRIDAATGVVSWTVGSAEVGGEYEVSVQVADGRGGVDVQTFALNVRERSFGTVVGTVYEDANENGRRDSTLVPGDEPLVVFVVDTSGSMGSGYSYSGDRVGDLNGSGADTRIDAVIYAMSQYRQSLVDKGLGDAADLALIDFSGTVRVNDMNPVEPGVQLVAPANADADGDGVPDFMEAAYKLNAERNDGTNYSVALNQAISLIQANGELDRETLVVFISDGAPNAGGSGANYADRLRQMGATVCAFGVGTGADASLQGIKNVDANGVWFDNMNDLRDVFAGLNGATLEYSEAGLEGWTVYVDVNNDGVWSTDEPSATTDANGVYELTDVPTGEYTLRAVRKNEWLQSQPLENGGFEIVVRRAETVRGKEFGFYRQGTASIAGRLLFDENGDGVQDANETTGLANQLVWLDQDGDGMLGWNESSALTDENGFYLFENLPAGEYRVRYQPAYGFAQTYPVDGEWSVEDNLIVNGDFEDVIAFGGNVYEGRAGESAIVGWEITSGSVTIHTPSHNEMYDGVYCVDLQGLAAGSIAQTFATVPGNRYAVQYVVAGNTDGAPSLKRYAISNGVDVFYGTFDVSDKSSNEMGWEVRTWNFVAATEETTLVFSGLDSTPYGASIDDVYVAPTTAAGIPGAHTVVLSAGQSAKDRDFGAYRYASLDAESGVSGRVFDDRNRNGAQDPGENGLSNRVVWLDQNKNDVLDEGERVATTDENGDYAFENLLAGEYRVVLDADETQNLQTFPSGRLWDASAENLIVDGAFDGEYGDASDAVSQTFATIPGTRYVVQYSVAGNGTSNVAQYAITAGVERCDGVFDASTTDAAWGVRSWSFVATSTETTLTFAGANEASSAALIEGVRVVPATSTPGGGWTVVLGASHWAQRCDFGVFDLTAPRPTLDVVSVPSGAATEGVAYRYDVEAVDSANEKLTYSLLVAPEGMAIHPELGVVVWTPSANDLGKRQVVVKVENESGLTASQAFEILVSPANHAPILITESVPTPAFVDLRYEVVVEAVDPDGDVLTYSFDAERGGTAPVGMTIDAESGKIAWTPTLEQLGEHTFTVVVADGRGAKATATATIRVVEQPKKEEKFETNDEGATDKNSAPILLTQEISNPAFVDSLYEVVLEATDPDGDALTYSFDAERGGTAPVGMTIDAESGKIAWTPTLEQLGEHTFTVVVADGRGAYATATATLSVVEYEQNAAPEFKTEPSNYALAGLEYLYRPQIVDANGDAFTLTLREAPEGTTFDPETNLLRWTPTLDDVGTTVRVALEAKDVRGASATQVWEIAVCADCVNLAPTIVSQPSNLVQPGETYVYDVVAVDPENDALVYSLTTGPDGMAIDALTGKVRWTPTGNDLGVSVVSISVEDASGNRCSQQFEILTFMINLPPQIISSAPSGVYAGDAYFYAIEVYEPEEDPVAFRLEEAPEGMTIDSQTGLVRWATTAADVGEYSFGVVLSDGFNEYGVRYEIVVLEKPNISVGDAENNPPQILSTPEQYGEVGARYEYAVVATDPDGDALSYSLEAAPKNATIDPLTGVLTWTPNASQVGVSDFIVVVADARGAATVQEFNFLTRSENAAPIFESTPDEFVYARNLYSYDVSVVDPEGDAVFYAVEEGPEGATIDANGRFRWTADATLGERRITISATDVRGNKTTQSWTLNVEAQGPKVQIVADEPFYPVAENFSFYVALESRVGIRKTAVTLVSENGDAVNAISIRGSSTILANAPHDGSYVIRVEATDLDGFTTVETKTILCAGVNPSAPIAYVKSPNVESEEVLIQKTTPIVGDVYDPDGDLEYFTVSIGAYGLDPKSEEGWRLLYRQDKDANSDEPLELRDHTLYVFDPSLYADGWYTMRVQGYDARGNTGGTTIDFFVLHDSDWANFSFSFTDLNAQTSSIPFVMTRTYDTKLSGQDGEFGYGWSHTFRDLKIQTNVKSPNESWGGYEPFAYGGSKVTITLPDGSRDVFEFKPSADGLEGGYKYIPGLYAPKFESTTGSGGTLTLDGASYAQNQLNYLRVLDDGSCYVWGQAGLAYNPFNPTINRGFTYTTKEGLKYHIDAQTMKVDTISDPFGHKLSFDGNEIFDERGDSVVTFERDGRDRITAIKLADGRSVRYTYDALGNLSTFTGLDGQTITYRYYDAVKGREHYIRSILDAEGNEALTLRYDDFGRVVGLADVTGAGVEVSYDSDNFVRTTVDQLGNATVEELDEYGNVLKTVTPEGGKILATYDENGNRLSETTVVYDADGNVFAELTTKSTYDSRGNVASETDAYGNVTSYTYDAYGQVTSTTTNGITVSTRYDSKTGAPISGVDEYGRVTTYGVDSSGNLTSMKNENGDVLTNLAYDGSDNLTNAVIDGFRTTYFAYDSRGNQTDAWFFDGETKVCDKTYYDSADRVVGTARYVGTTLIYSTETIYNALGQVVSETDRVGLKTEYLYDARGYVVQTRRQVVDASGVPVWFVERSVYDAKGQAIAQTDSVREGTDDAILGTVLTYDKDGRVVRTSRVAEMIVEIDEDGFSTLTSVGAEIYAESTVYNNAGWKLEEIDRYSLSTRYSCDKFGNVVETIQERVDENGNVQNVVSRTVYDNCGRVWLETSAALESETLVAGTRTEYDVHGNRLSVENLTNVLLQDVVELSGTANYRDALVSGTLTSLTSSTYVNGAQTESVDALGGRSTFEYDSTGRLTSQTSATGVVNSYVYNDFGLVVEQTATTATASATQKYEYDYQDRLVKTTYDDGTTFESVYDDAGNLIAEKNRGGQVKRYEYDSANRLTAVEIASGTDVEARYEYEYDAAGNRTVIRDALGRETRYVYDAAGNVLSRTLPLGTAQGADSQSFTEYFEYDAFGRTARAVSFEGVVTRYEYDAYGRLARVEYYASEADESNGKLDYAYSYKTDVYGRTIATTKASASGAILREEATTYSSSGSVVTVSGAEGVIRYEYDVYGRLTRTSSDRGDDVSYGYDEFGRLTTVCDAAQNDLTTTYSYDDRGNLAKTVVSSGITTTYRYNASNRLVETTNFVDANANGVWDAASESRISQFEYGYDALGQKTSATERFGDGDSQTIRTTWTYDGQNRLTQEVFEHYDDELDQTLAWTYDLVGNRLTQTRDLGNDGTVDERTSYRYDANDRLIQEIFDGDADGVFERTTDYDWLATQQVGATVTENGTVVKQTTYAYNAQGLTSEITIVENGASTRVRYEYDSAGARVATTTEIDADGDGTFEKATRTEFLNDANNPTGYSQVLRKTETDLATGEETVTSYTIGLDQIAQTVVAPDGTETTRVFTYDGRGSTRALVDLLGTVAETYSYDAYGNAIGFDPANAATDYLHNGEPFDAKTGRVYLRARDYDPATGRFTTLDPFYGDVDDPQSLHKYAFAENDPIQKIDPTGMFSMANLNIMGGLQAQIGALYTSSLSIVARAGQVLRSVKEIHHAYRRAMLIAKRADNLHIRFMNTSYPAPSPESLKLLWRAQESFKQCMVTFRANFKSAFDFEKSRRSFLVQINLPKLIINNKVKVTERVIFKPFSKEGSREIWKYLDEIEKIISNMKLY